MPDFKAFPSPSQPYRDVMYFDASADPAHLFETARQRMTAVIDLLQLVEQAENGDFVQREAARLSFAVGLLLRDARSLYEAAHERASPIACRAEAGGVRTGVSDADVSAGQGVHRE